MPVQDDERERELVRAFNLNWDPAHQRSGIDAKLEIELGTKKYEVEIEVKSTTGDTVSTARDVGMDHIQRWRRQFFVIGFYTKDQKRPELKTCLCLTPLDMEPWIAAIEAKIMIDFKLAQLASKKLSLTDLFDVCGKKEAYSISDAKYLHKQQWSNEQYNAARDMKVGNLRFLSPKKMLELLQLRSRYIAERGATLNNPHIPKAHLQTFFASDRKIGADWAGKFREIVKKFIEENPTHPSVISAD